MSNFWGPVRSLDEIITEQGIKPLVDFDALVMPEDVLEDVIEYCGACGVAHKNSWGVGRHAFVSDL